MARRALILCVIVLGCRPAQQSGDHDPTLILISIDGFRADYLDRFEVPNLRTLAEEGVYAPEGMTPVFPTKTFPNHYTIATGLYPARHGIVANTMYDSERDAWFRISDRDAVEDPYWWEGEPIWVTAELQGQVSATYFWVGSEAPVKGIRPTYWFRHDASVPGEARVDQVLQWLDLPKADRPTVITLYFSDVDTRGHLEGPASRDLEAAVEATDRHLGRLLAGLRQRGLTDVANLVIVSDHGMEPTDRGKVVYLEDYLPQGLGQIVEYSPVLAINPHPGRETQVRESLARMPGADVLSTEDLQAYHYSGHRRIPGVLAQARPGWTIYSTREFHQRSGGPNPGDHGYAPGTPGMQAVFVARGPAFRERTTVASFEAVHLYNALAATVGLTPAPNDGDIDVAESILRQP